MKEKIKNGIPTLVTAIIVFVIGILCIVADNASGLDALDAYENISVVLGITLLVVSGLGILLQCLVFRRAATSENLSKGLILAAGIYFVANKMLAGDLLSAIVEYVPFVLIVIGSLFALDAILVLTFAFVQKNDVKSKVVVLAIELVIAILAILFGVFALPSVEIITKKFTILGIIMIVYALFLILGVVLTFLNKKIPANNIIIEGKAN